MEELTLLGERAVQAKYELQRMTTALGSATGTGRP